MSTFFHWLGILILSGTLLRAAENGVGAPSVQSLPEGRRYLFLVDVSGGTKHCREAIERMVHDLIASGMNGEMKPGDAFAIWPFRDRVMTDQFQPQTWLPEVKEDLANAAGAFIRQHGFTNTALLSAAVDQAMKVVSASKAVMILIINDGGELLQGTPFDAYANGIYKEHVMELWREKRPFVTALLGVKGSVVACAVSYSGDKISLPQSRDTAKLSQLAESMRQTVGIPAPAPPVKSQPVQSPPTVPVPAKESPPPVSSPPPVAPAPRFAAPPTTSEPYHPAVSAGPSVPEASAPAHVPAPTPPPARPMIPPTLAKVASPPEGAISPTQLLVIGIVLLFVAAIIIWIMMRGRRDSKPASLITRSMRH